ncbi:MAG: hypothetical protein IKF07_04215 [Eubacterium sp.]|nr:hypothetical protein [Eubacterium sp.]
MPFQYFSHEDLGEELAIAILPDDEHPGKVWLGMEGSEILYGSLEDFDHMKGIGTQFDPEYAKIMIRMIDQDVEYKMQEEKTGATLTSAKSIRCDTLYHECTEGVLINDSTA